MGNSHITLKKGPEMVFTLILETTSIPEFLSFNYTNKLHKKNIKSSTQLVQEERDWKCLA